MVARKTQTIEKEDAVSFEVFWRLHRQLYAIHTLLVHLHKIPSASNQKTSLFIVDEDIVVLMTAICILLALFTPLWGLQFVFNFV